MDVGGSNRREGNGSRQSRPRSGAGSGKSPGAGLSRDSLAAASPSAAGAAAPVLPLGDEKLAFTFPTGIDKGHDVQKQILSAAEKRGFHGDNLFALHIALEEALINAIKHGNRLDARKMVHVEAKVGPKRVEIMVEDEGAGFDRKAVPDPTSIDNLHKCSGRGILLIESYMSDVKWDRGGRRLQMARENRD